jgi:hypothetical protein
LATCLAAFFQRLDALILFLIDYQKTAIAQQKTAIATSVQSLIQQAEAAQRSRFLGSVVPAMGVLLGAVGLGVIIGLAVPPWLQGGLDPTGSRQLTLEQAETLRWALGSEGKFARKLIRSKRAAANPRHLCGG